MKTLILLAAAAALVSATVAEAKGGRIRFGGPRASAPAPKPQALPQPVQPRASGSSGGLIIVPVMGSSRASAAPSDQRRGLQSQDWRAPEARQQATPEWFKAAAAEAARSASSREQSALVPRPQKAGFQCPPAQLAGGFCVLN
ncbi:MULTISPECIES: hypothetical protein [unclassified Beijerinckia]|uniref:hypothetical protein n=1 Tax=unclassified Beijerinckia TaxID=2638183 RepID=UPI000895F566|nr:MULTISPECIES: hypothetical protein [unclassified Beijerinckia]MDH7794407.1 hypothetical protein [Beijerinckia sp. GAS462]SEB61317.1 hypothetical protein SAMN05443249_0678 [Beijerinckia sp. 28-YEA-48]